MRPSGIIEIQRTLGTAEQRDTLSGALRKGRKLSIMDMLMEYRLKDMVLYKLRLSGYPDNHFKGTEMETQ